MAQSIGEIEATLKLKDELTGQIRLATKEVEKAGAQLQDLDKIGSKGLGNLQTAATGGSDALGLLARNAGALVGAGIATALVGITTSAIKSADALVDMSSKTGLSIDFLQRAGYVAEQSGSNLDSFTDSAFKLGVNVAKGTKAAADGLAAMGLSLKDVQGLKLEDMLGVIIPKLAAMEDANKRNAVAVALFGKGVADNIPAMIENFQKLAAEAPVASEAQIRALAATADAWDRLKSRISANTTDILGSIALITEHLGKGGLSGVFEDLAKNWKALLLAGPTGAIVASIANENAQTALNKARTDAAKTTTVTTQAETDYAKALAETQKVLSGLSPETKRQIDAGIKLGVSAQELEERFGLAEGALRLYTAASKEASSEHRTAEKAEQARIKSLENLQSSLADLTASEYDQIAAALANGKAQGDIAKAYKVTAQQVDDVAKSEQALATQRKREADNQKTFLSIVTALNEKLAQQALELTKLKLKGIEQIDDAERAFAAEQADRTRNSLEKEVAAAQERARQMKNSFSGSIDDQARYFQIVEAGTAEHIANLQFAWEQGFFEWFAHEQQAMHDEALAASEKFAADLADVILQAITGGGDIGGAIGGFLGRQLGTRVGSAVGEAIGGSLGAALGSVIPGIGTALGGALGSLVGDFFSNVFGRGAGRAMIEEWAATFDESLQDNRSGFDDLHDRLLQLGERGEQLWRNLGNGTRTDKEAAQRAMDAITEALGEFDAAMGRAGLSTDDLNGGMGRLSRQADQLESDFRVLTQAGFSVEQVTRGNADALNELIRTALDTGQQIPAALEPMLVQLAQAGLVSEDLRRRLLGLPEAVDWKQMAADAEKFGIDIAGAGKQFEQAKIDDTAAEIVAVWDRWKKAGADMSVVAQGLSDEVSDLVNDALRMGLTLPAGMQPIIQAMFEAGQLTNDAGDAITDISGLTFAPTLEESLGDLVDAIRDLIDILTDDLPDAARTGAQEVEDAFNNMKIRLPKWLGGGGGTPPDGEPSAPGLATGGYVPARPGGQFFRLGEGGEGEWVIPESMMAGGRSSTPTVIHNHVYIGEEEIMDRVVTLLPGQLYAAGVTR